jgi:hypothetical protein
VRVIGELQAAMAAMKLQLAAMTSSEAHPQTYLQLPYGTATVGVPLSAVRW